MMLKRLHQVIGIYAATLVCWISARLDNNLWEDEA